MNRSYDKNAALVVLPPVSAGRLQNRSLRTWLARSDLSYQPEPEELLARVARELGLTCPATGFAALRMWGQTGDRPTKWIAAADPVYLEPRLDRLCLHALRRVGVPAGQMRTLIDYLQATLADEDTFGFTRLGNYCYLSSRTPVSTATMPAYVVDQQDPGDFLPTGEDAATHRKLICEIEMTLHDHEVNTRREAQGQSPINSLWLWGGGIAPEQTTTVQPPLFSDDALLSGYWFSATAVVEPWLGTIAACIDSSVAGFVAETPEFDDSPEFLEACLLELRAALRSRRLSRVTVLFRDGVRADIRRSHTLRLWRRDSKLLAAGPA